MAWVYCACGKKLFEVTKGGSAVVGIKCRFCKQQQAVVLSG